MKKLLAIAVCSLITLAFAADIKVEMNEVNAEGVATSVGFVTISETEFGLVFTPELKGLAAGIHGFHVHANPDCGTTAPDGTKGPALAAGGHFDPKDTKKHGAPWADGHLGDLPPLLVVSEGTADTAVLAPRIKTLAEIKDRALMIHVSGDNFSDDPKPLGGGGARLACGVIK